MGVHKKEKTFKCNQCEYATLYSHQLKRHVSSFHKKPKPFNFEMCSFRASNPTALKTHVGLFIIKKNHLSVISAIMLLLD